MGSAKAVGNGISRSMKMESRVLSVSKYCEECLKFKQGNCEGKKAFPKNAAFWGTEKSVHLSGLHFCKLYECDPRLYEFADGSGKIETIHTVRKRQVERDEEISNQEAFDDFDLGASLSSADFEV